jgi:hypothetical protein
MFKTELQILKSVFDMRYQLFSTMGCFEARVVSLTALDIDGGTSRSSAYLHNSSVSESV